MQADVYNLEGKKEGSVQLPAVFDEEVRSDVIRRAFLAARSAHIQPKGPSPLAGFKTSADFVGRRRAYRSMQLMEHAKLPRVFLPKGGRGEVRRVPQSRKGHAAHPLKPEKIWLERINAKENAKARRSAIAATAHHDLVEKRGHKAPKSVPVIVTDAFEKISKTKQARSVLEKLGLADDLARAESRSIKPGRGKMRGRRYRRSKSVLIVTSNGAPVIKAAKNIPGVDAVSARGLNAVVLAPGGVAGRLTVYTQAALKELEKL